MYLTLWRYPHVLRTSTIRRAENELDPFIRFDTIPACGIGTAEHSTYLYSIAAQRRAVKKLSKSELPSRTWPNAPRPSSWPTRYLRPISAELRPGSETCLVASSCELEADRRERLTA